jgi:hypothetical protein
MSRVIASGMLLNGRRHRRESRTMRMSFTGESRCQNTRLYHLTAIARAMSALGESETRPAPFASGRHECACCGSGCRLEDREGSAMATPGRQGRIEGKLAAIPAAQRVATAPCVKQQTVNSDSVTENVATATREVAKRSISVERRVRHAKIVKVFTSSVPSCQHDRNGCDGRCRNPAGSRR